MKKTVKELNYIPREYFATRIGWRDTAYNDWL